MRRFSKTHFCQEWGRYMPMNIFSHKNQLSKPEKAMIVKEYSNVFIKKSSFLKTKQHSKNFSKSLTTTILFLNRWNKIPLLLSKPMFFYIMGKYSTRPIVENRNLSQFSLKIWLSTRCKNISLRVYGKMDWIGRCILHRWIKENKVRE